MIQYRNYHAHEVVGFHKVREAWGEFSNMHGGLPLVVGGHSVRSTEHLYQAMRFDCAPEIQQEILSVASPMYAKRTAYKHIAQTRKDWQQVNIGIMRYALRLKLHQHHNRLSALYLDTKGRAIVEISTKDDFWGAKPLADGSYHGRNVLGRLHMELCAELQKDPEAYLAVMPAPSFPSAILLGSPIPEMRITDHIHDQPSLI